MKSNPSRSWCVAVVALLASACSESSERSYATAEQAEIEFVRGWLNEAWVPDDARNLVLKTELDSSDLLIRYEASAESVERLSTRWVRGKAGSGRAHHRWRGVLIVVAPWGDGVRVVARAGDVSSRDVDLLLAEPQTKSMLAFGPWM